MDKSEIIHIDSSSESDEEVSCVEEEVMEMDDILQNNVT